MPDELSDIGDLVFSIVIGYIGALELLYVVRHLYHWSFRHDGASSDVGSASAGDSLKCLQDSMRNQLADAENREAPLAAAGAKVMKDGVVYKDGFRVDLPQAANVDVEQLQNERRKEIAEELARQRQIEEQTRQQLELAEEELQHQRQQAAEEEAAENARRLLEAERARKEEQKRREVEEQEAAENARRLLEVERAREEEQKRREVEEQEAAESARSLLEAERALEEEQKRRDGDEQEAEESARRLLEAERAAAAIESLIIPDDDDLDGLTAILNRKETEASEQLLGEDERQRRQLEKQRLIEENARKFLEAEQRMVEQMQHMDERLHQRQQSLDLEGGAPTAVAIEEPCLKKLIRPLTEPADDAERCTQTVKTQFGQTSNDQPYAVRTKALLFPGVSDEGSSNEPASSAQSSFSAQLSEDIGTATGSEMYPPAERQEPEGEDNAPSVQYTDEYLRSLDGIKQRPLVREDGSGRRRAFKKRRSSGSSNSSRESRTSREEELKMFTSLEEEELDRGQAKGDAEEFARIKYTCEPTLKVKGHHKRHKRSPAKDMRTSDDNLRTSLEMLGEETTNPWGEVLPEHYKDTAFWKREKAISIDEEEIDLEKAVTAADGATRPESPRKQYGADALNVPKTSSFEEATHTQHEEAISALKQKQSAGTPVTEDATASTLAGEEAKEAATRSDTNQNLQTAHETVEHERSPSRSSVSPRLRRSPRIEEMDQYEERWVERNPVQPQTPTVTVEDTAPWRDEHGLLMEGLSDFYDFSASVNPSRSRSTSRNPSPFNSPPCTPAPKSSGDDAAEWGNVAAGDCHTDQSITVFIQSMSHDHDAASQPTNADIESTRPHHPPNSGECLRVERNRSRSRSRSPLPTADNVARSLETRKTKMIRHNDELFEKLIGTAETAAMQVVPPAVEPSHSRSRSKSPLPSPENMEHNLQTRRKTLIKRNDAIFERIEQQLSPPIATALVAPTISVEECVDAVTGGPLADADDAECSREEMSNLVASLRWARSSRSRSKSPMRLPSTANMAASVETRRKRLIERNDQMHEQLQERTREDQRGSRSRSPSRSMSRSPPEQQRFAFVERPPTKPNFEIDENERTARAIANLSDYYDFHTMLNLEASQNRTLSKNSEELESMLAAKQRQVDREALHQLNTANEETELRTLTPLGADNGDTDGDGDADVLGELKSPRFRDDRRESSPNVPEYDRTQSAEWRDVQRIKTDLLASGFKRSTYAGESMDLAGGGSEYEAMRRAAMHFRRSQSPSRSLNLSGAGDVEEALQSAADRRIVQDEILNELISAGANNTADAEARHGAKPKRPLSSESSEWSVSQEALDTLRLKEDMLRSGFKRSTYVGESVDLAARKIMELEEMRREMADFRRSQSRSRSPLNEWETSAMQAIELEAAKREMKDMILDEIEQTTISFQDFSRHLNVNFLDNDRRASDSALIQKPEILLQLQRDCDADLEMDPEEYHHFRRFSLNQEQPVEEYPNDDYVYISQIEVRTPTGTRTWLREDFYSDSDSMGECGGSDGAVGAAAPPQICHEAAADDDVDDYTDGSEDERRTVVEVDDEIDTDICDFNERGPADESHHEQSECEEADREVDRYANRSVADWRDIEQQVVNEIFDYNNALAEPPNAGVDTDGAVGGRTAAAYDSDSFTIDQMYDDAIRNRKASGILRDYDCILKDMQNHYMESEACGRRCNGDSDPNTSSDSERYALWAKARHLERASNASTAPLALLLEHERRDTEMRYLGDANVTSRQSTRLRSRYGYVPVLQGAALEEDEPVDLNYKPKREYNWRKNFKIDDNEAVVHDNGHRQSHVPTAHPDCRETLGRDESDAQHIDLRKFSLGGESITLFSRSPERLNAAALPPDSPADEPEPNAMAEAVTVAVAATAAKPKKKKIKKKKSSRENSLRDEEDSESQSMAQPYSGRSSGSLQADSLDEISPKRKSRSRRSSKSSLTSLDEPPNGMAAYSPRTSLAEELPASGGAIVEATPKKKIKKRSKRSTKEPERMSSSSPPAPPTGTAGCATAAGVHELGTPGDALPAQKPPNAQLPQIQEESDVTTTATTAKSAEGNRTPVDTFDILKDANFYPLF